MDEKREEIEIRINGTPDLKLMPKEVAEAFFAALEMDICARLESKKVEENEEGG